jgi:hypothetical protein
MQGSCTCPPQLRVGHSQQLLGGWDCVAQKQIPSVQEETGLSCCFIRCVDSQGQVAALRCQSCGSLRGLLVSVQPSAAPATLTADVCACADDGALRHAHIWPRLSLCEQSKPYRTSSTAPPTPNIATRTRRPALTSLQPVGKPESRPGRCSALSPCQVKACVSLNTPAGPNPSDVASGAQARARRFC